MHTSARLFAIFGLVLSLLGATVLTASAAVTTFTVTVINCATDDVPAGQVDWLFGVDAAAGVDCVTSTFAPDDTAISLYAAGDLTTPLATGTIAGGAGSGSLTHDFEGTASFVVGVGTAPDEITSGPFSANAGENQFIYGIRYEAAPATEGNINVFKYACVDDQLAATDPVVFDLQFAIDTTACDFGNGYLIGLVDADDTSIVISEPAPTVEGFIAFEGLAPGTYRLIENGETSDVITIVAAGDSLDVQVVNYVASQPVDGSVELTNLSCVGDNPGTSIFAAAPGEPVIQPAATLECAAAAGSFEIYLNGDTSGQPVALDADGSGLGSVTLPPGTHTIVDPVSGASESFTVAANATTQILVQTVVAPAPTTGSVLISAFTCIGVEAGVEIEASEPTFAADAVDLTECDPLNALSFSIFPFGDEGATPITGTTDDDGNGDGTVLLTDIPSTEGDAAAHLFTTVVFDSDFEAPFDVATGAVTAITVVVFEPAPPTATATATTVPPTATATTAPATNTPAAQATATGTVSTLPSTGAGGGLAMDGGAAWLLAGVFALIALGSAGFVVRRRAA